MTGEVVALRYNYRIRPGAGAVRYLTREWDRCRWVWNELCAESKRRHRRGETFGYKAQDQHLTMLRQSVHDPDTGDFWLADGSSVAQQQLVRDFAASRAKALKDIVERVPVGKRRGLPRFKKRDRARPSLNYTRRGFSLRDGRLCLPTGVSVPVVWSRDLPGEPGSVRIHRDACGDWWASFAVTAPVQPLPATGVDIGVDWGVRETATTTDPRFDLPHSEHGKRAAARLARYQRMMARRRRAPGRAESTGYRKAKKAAARQHRTVARQRADTGHKWAKSMVRAHDRIAVEDFHPKFLAKSTMARKAADAAIAATKAALLHQATKHQRQLVLIDPRYTTMDCGNCGARTTHRLPLSQRIYQCDSCGATAPRDRNSATVVAARAGFDPVDVESVRLAHSPSGRAA